MRISLLPIAMVSLSAGLAACGAETYRDSISEDPFNQPNPQTSSAFHSPQGWDASVVFYVDEFAPENIEIASLAAAETWNDAVGYRFLRYGGRAAGGRGDSLYASLNDTQTIVYNESDWQKTTGKSPVILATTVWENNADSGKIVKGDIILNAEFYLLQDAEQAAVESGREDDVVDAETVLLHEMGHLLGLSHFDSDPDSVMNTYTSIGVGHTRRTLSQDDQINIGSVYGE